MGTARLWVKSQWGILFGRANTVCDLVMPQLTVADHPELYPIGVDWHAEDGACEHTPLDGLAATEYGGWEVWVVDVCTKCLCITDGFDVETDKPSWIPEEPK